jgi:RNA polymerase sigma-70 factor (ECF subfamily)
MDVQALVRRAQEQDGQAFGALYELYARKVYSYLYYHLNGRAQEAEDLTADIFIKVFEKISSYQFRGVPFSAWLFRIAHNHLIDHVRSRPRQPLVPLEAVAEIKETATLQEIDRRLTIEQLSGALTQLTREQRQVIILRFIEGLSTAETAQATGKTEDAVKKLQARGLATLKRVLEREERAAL